jgi:hypothetical protein
MIRLTDEQWERIRDHFPEEHIADGRPVIQVHLKVPRLRRLPVFGSTFRE